MPDPTTLRRYQLPKLYNIRMDQIKSELINEKLWISIDETTDSTGRHIAIVIIGTLKKGESRTFIFTAEILEKTNHTTICQLFNKSINLLYGTEIKHENVLLFLTDAARYMIKAGKISKSFYPKMIHVTCVLHAMHRVAEKNKILFPWSQSANIKCKENI